MIVRTLRQKMMLAGLFCVTAVASSSLAQTPKPPGKTDAWKKVQHGAPRSRKHLVEAVTTFVSRTSNRSGYSREPPGGR